MHLERGPANLKIVGVVGAHVISLVLHIQLHSYVSSNLMRFLKYKCMTSRSFQTHALALHCHFARQISMEVCAIVCPLKPS